MVVKIEAPAHAGLRDQARELVEHLDASLAGIEVVLDCSRLLVGTPSFLDEILKAVLVERAADSLRVRCASSRVRDLLARSAANRKLSARVVFAGDGS